jgi:hypothetical protein
MRASFTKVTLYYTGEDQNLVSYSLTRKQTTTLLDSKEHHFERVVQLKVAQPLQLLYFSTKDNKVQFVSFGIQKGEEKFNGLLKPRMAKLTISI